MQGTNRVFIPEKEGYQTVYGKAVNSRDTIIPSGANQVGGLYYEWDDSGFTGMGFFTNIENGPTANFGFTSDEDVLNYLNSQSEGQKNLNAVFRAWQDFIDSLPADDAWNVGRRFEDAVHNAGGTACIHR